ncbi:MAG: class I tRNA ligase family protein [Firmicutes bacterium]|nr:class I tRNA ligase family protein [Bacillota bacterium]
MNTKNKKKYYITTPIYYPSGAWHIGHCYTTVACDAIARFKRMQGYEVFYLTGTDEHGQKILKNATEKGITPIEFVNPLVENIKELWSVLDISYDGFIRTTDEFHKKAVQNIFTRLYEKGDIYKSVYKGKYCAPCETFLTETQLKDGNCPDCNREVNDAEEEAYFFRLSKYGEQIKKHLSETDFLVPKARANEMIKFIEAGLEDLAVTRTSFDWGVKVPFDEKHVIYVWIDALSNYITALGHFGKENGECSVMCEPRDKKTNNNTTLHSPLSTLQFWPADLHMMAKEITRFHAIIWPAILLSLELSLPKQIYSHGWILFDGGKMSKSVGNVVDPFILSERYSADALRYFLLSELSYGQDSNYSSEQFLTKVNSDLVNDLGNLTKRTLSMVKQYFKGKVKIGKETEHCKDFIEKVNALNGQVDEKIKDNDVAKAISTIFSLISHSNKYIDLTAPWALNKEGKFDLLSSVLFNLLEAIRVSSTLLKPFLTKTPSRIFEAIKIKEPTDFKKALHNPKGSYNVGTNEAVMLFPRLDIKKELEELASLAE